MLFARKEAPGHYVVAITATAEIIFKKERDAERFANAGNRGVLRVG